MKANFSIVLVLCALFAIAVAGMHSVQSGGLPTWLNYQGRLTQPTGAAVADGSYQATFRIFDAPTGGNQLWTETSAVAAKQGVFSTTLGKVTPFPSDLFTRRLWLEPEIEGRVLTPRQEMGAVAFAMTAQTALTVPDGSITETKLAAGLAVPVGTVVSWWGNSASVPSGWKLCDGTIVSDSQSPLNGLASPELRNRFIRGTTGNVRPNAPLGGSDSHTLTVAEMPAHSHGVNDPGHSHQLLAQAWSSVTGNGQAYPINTGSTINPTPILSAFTGITIQSAGGGQAFSTLPGYVGLVYIMRVR